MLPRLSLFRAWRDGGLCGIKIGHGGVGEWDAKELDNTGKEQIGLRDGGVRGFLILHTENRFEGANGALYGDPLGIKHGPSGRAGGYLGVSPDYLMTGAEQAPPTPTISLPVWHYEYKSSRTLFGLPLIHINLGNMESTGPAASPPQAIPPRASQIAAGGAVRAHIAIGDAVQ